MSKSNKSKLVPGIGRLPYPAYQGDKPYIFVSYSHKDSNIVFNEIKRFNEAGYHVWYDEGITPGNEWDDEIADALSKCALFVVFLSKNSVLSPNVADEIKYSIQEKIPHIGIYLEECELQGGLKLRFQNKQAILKYNMTEEEYEYKYQKAFDMYRMRETVTAADNGGKEKEERQPEDTKEERGSGERVNSGKQKKATRIACICLAALIAGAGIFSLFKYVILPNTQNGEPAATTAAKQYSYVKNVEETESPPAAEPDSSKDYVPKGTAVITTNDGKAVTAIANSLTMYAADIESDRSAPWLYMGLDNALPEDFNSSENSYSGENMIYFADMTGVERASGALRITDIDGKQTDVTPPDTAELWYLGEANDIKPETVLLSNVKSISFDRDSTPDFEVRYARVSTTQENYLSPVAYIWFNINLSSGGIPSMKLSQELTIYTDQPVTVQNMKKYVVTKNGKSGTSFSAPEGIECRAELRNGDDVSFEMSGYFSFFAMGHNGAIKRPAREDLKEIDFYPE